MNLLDVAHLICLKMYAQRYMDECEMERMRNRDKELDKVFETLKSSNHRVLVDEENEKKTV